MINPLTNKEIQVIKLLQKELSRSEIADQLNLKFSTVNSHLKNIFLKLDVKSSKEAVTKALELSIIK